MRPSKLISIMIFILALTLVGGVVNAEDKIRLKIGMAKPIQAGKAFAIVKTIFINEVNKRVKAETNYEIEWVEAYGGVVAKDGEVLEAVQMGMLDIGYVIFLFEPAKLFLHNFGYFVPFSSPDQVMVNKITAQLFNEFPVLTNVFEEKYNQKMLCAIPTTSYQLITTFPVKTTEDLKGRKIAAGGPNLVAIKPLGAAPVQSAIGEGYTSFKTGVYDGWLILESIMAGLKWPEVAPYVTIVDLGSAPGVALTINKKTWEKLPPEVRKIIAESAVMLADQGSREMATSVVAVREHLKKSGATVTVLDPKERLKWARSLPDVAAKKAAEADEKGLPGSKVIKRYIELQEKAGYEFPRKWNVQ